MIRYALVCEHDHPFDAWFGASSDYDDQIARGLVECPFCASTRVRKQIMAPAVRSTKTSTDAPAPDQVHARMMEAMGKVRRHVETNFDYVGDRFAREARDIHDGESEARGIYGEASPKEVKALIEDGIQVAPLPPAATPKAKTEVN
ncbi:MAG TPA: DUF1178 family protein [Caulobacteraceae bacterium]|nr:DUF1178 family protein [Caulobacteraceae bacterium]